MRIASRSAFALILTVSTSAAFGFFGCHPTPGKGQDAAKATTPPAHTITPAVAQGVGGPVPPPKDFTLHHVQFAPSGSLLLAMDGPPHDNVYLWDTEKRKELWQGQIKGVTSARFFQDGKRIAFGCFGGSILIWDTEKHETLFTLSAGLAQVITNLLISADQRRLVSVGFEEIKLWELTTRSLVFSLAGPQEVLVPVPMIWSEEGKKFLIIPIQTRAGVRKLVEVDLVAGKVNEIGRLPQPGVPGFLANGKRVVSFEVDLRQITIYSVPSLKPLTVIANELQAAGPGAISSDGKLMMTGYYTKGGIDIWQVDPLKILRSLSVSEGSSPASSAFSPDSKLVAIGGGIRGNGPFIGMKGRDKVGVAPTLYLFEVESGKLVATLMSP